MQNILLECYGMISKNEEIRILKDSIFSNTLVLESVQPFSGYYSQTPEETIPQTVYLALNAEYAANSIDAATQHAKSTVHVDFDATKSILMLDNQTIHSIRLFNIDNFAPIPAIQEAYEAAGVTMRTDTNVAGGTSYTTIQKVFELNEFKPGHYLNAGRQSMGYFEMPDLLTAAQFDEVLKLVNGNWEGACFDAAQGVLFRKKGAVDIVRIFTPSITEDSIVALSSLFRRFAVR